MTLLWSTADKSGWFSRNVPSDYQLRDVARLAGGDIVLLLEYGDNKWALVSGPGASGPERWMPVPMTAWGHRLFVGPGDALYAVGSANARSARWGSGRLSDGYLAKIDPRRGVIWERTFRAETEREIQSLVVLPSGDVAVVGRDDDRTWLARISAEGKLMWEFGFGVRANMSALAIRSPLVATGDRILVAAYDTNDELALWSFDLAGRLVSRKAVRSGGGRGAIRYADLRSGREGTAWLFAGLLELPATGPIEMVRIGAQGEIVARQELSETLVKGRHGSELCIPVITVLANGDPLLACSTDGRTGLSRIDARTDEMARSFVSVPPLACEGRRSPSNLLAQESETSVLVIGSGEGCIWLGRISIAR